MTILNNVTHYWLQCNHFEKVKEYSYCDIFQNNNIECEINYITNRAILSVGENILGIIPLTIPDLAKFFNAGGFLTLQ